MPQQAQAQHQPALTMLECHQQHTVMTAENMSMEQYCQQQPLQQMHQRSAAKKQIMAYKPKDSVDASTPSDSDNQRDNAAANTLPFRKAKKRIDAGAKSIGSNQQSARINVQNVFNQNVSVHHEHEYNEVGMNEASGSNQHNISICSSSSAGGAHSLNYKPRSIKKHANGVENTGFQAVDENNAFEPPESEVYFADVSSCCNTSLKNDTYYDGRQHQQQSHSSKQQHSSKKKRLENSNNDDSLTLRANKRESSVRSRLPFPQALGQDYDKNALLGLQQPMATSMRNSMIAKDLSRQSMCSMDSGEKTDFTDLSPATPCGAYNPAYPMQDYNISQSASASKPNVFCDFGEATNTSNFVALFPFSSNDQSQEAHRRSTKNLPEILMNSGDQFDDRETASGGSGGSNASTANANTFNNSNASSASSTSDQEQDSLNSYVDQLLNTSSKSNATPNKRSPISANISAIIQNISDRDVGLLYGGDSRRDSDSDGASGGADNSNINNSNEIAEQHCTWAAEGISIVAEMLRRINAADRQLGTEVFV